MPKSTNVKPEQEAPSVTASIGTLNERHLHASLRARYLQTGDKIEAGVDGYIVDILRGDLIIEIQTKNFSAIARKMRDLVTRHQVQLVYPIPRDVWIVRPHPSANGEAVRRKSPKHLDIIDVFDELVSFPDLIANKHFRLDVVLTEEERVETFDSRKNWRRRGWVTVERRLIEVHGTVSLHNHADYLSLIPIGLPAEFLTSDVASALKRPRALAQKVAYCLRKCGLIEQVGTRRNAIVYSRVQRDGSRGRRGRGNRCVGLEHHPQRA